MANDFLVFGGDPGSNVMTQAAYAALAARTAGFASGVAQSAQLNKVWRQSSIMSAMIGQFIADNAGGNAVDDGTIATLLANLKIAISKAGITQPQFDNDTDYATTAFVQRALGSIRGTAVLNASTTLTAATHAGRLIQFDSMAANGNCTLPLASTCPDGTMIHIRNVNGTSLITVLPQGGDVIGLNSGDSVALGNPILGNGDTLSLESNGTNSWRAIAGSALLKYQGVFAANLATPGFQKLPSGWIVQMGGMSGSSGVANITFPVAFPNNCVAVIPTTFGGAVGAVNAVSLQSNTLTTAVITCSQSVTFGGRYIAIGY